MIGGADEDHRSATVQIVVLLCHVVVVVVDVSPEVEPGNVRVAVLMQSRLNPVHWVFKTEERPISNVTTPQG